MKTLGYYNGKIDELDKMQVPMLDRACYFGDGIYDTALVHNYKVFALDVHIDRFFKNAKLMDFNLSFSKEELKNILMEMIHKMDDGDLFLYWQASRGTAIRSHIYPENMQANLWIMLWPKKLVDKNKTLRLVFEEDTRNMHNHIKTINLIPAVTYATYAHRHQFDESILHRGNRVTEGSKSNISILKEGVLYTAPCDEYILPGIIRSYLLEACKIHNIPVKEEAFSVEDVKNADEIIVTSSTYLCLRASELEHKEIGGKDLETFKKLQDTIFTKFEEACK